LPLYLYPLKAGQVSHEQSDDKLKEECELKATHSILPIIREQFPRMAIVLLGDTLYANKPMICLCEELGIDYMIVLKDKVLKTLNKRCDQLGQTKLYQQQYTLKVQERFKQGLKHREARWFNNVEIGEEVFTNVLRYQEAFEKNGLYRPGYKGAWICSKKISKENCFKRSDRGRMRWDQEDLHNTAKNRGLAIKHDMARANPNLLFVWKLINFIAHFVFTLFEHTTIARVARGPRSLKKFARDLLGQLIDIAWAVISQSIILAKERVQFRYVFDSA
jgi:hypothetical protein